MSNKNKKNTVVVKVENSVPTPEIVSTPAIAPKIELPANFMELGPLQQAILINKLQKQLAPVLEANKEKEVSALKAEIAEYETKIEACKEKLKAYGVGTRGRPYGSKNAPKTEAEAQAEEDKAAIAEFDAETAPAPIAQAA